MTRRQSVRAHAAFLAAGSDLILMTGFGANRPRLEPHRQGDQVAALIGRPPRWRATPSRTIVGAPVNPLRWRVPLGQRAVCLRLLGR